VGSRTLFLLVALGALRDASCGTDTPAGGPNTPCTRSSDCRGGLTCTPGGCVAADAAVPDGGPGDSGAIDAAGAD
jgi:hypothetical protein